MWLELKQLGQNWQLYAEFLLFLFKLIAYTVVASSNSWDFTHVCDYSIIRCYSSSAVNVISSWRWNLCGVWSYCHLVFPKVTDSQIKSILFSGLVSVQSTWLEVCFLTTAIFFPFFIFVLIQIVVQHPYIYGIWVNNTILLYSISSKITALPVLSHRI